MEETKNKKAIIKKVVSIVLDVIAGAFALFSIFVLILTVSMNNSNDGSATIFNTELRVVTSDSMEGDGSVDVSSYRIKSIPNKSCVFIDQLPTDKTKRGEWYSSINVGDVLTYKYVYYMNGNTSDPRQIITTHRVVDIVSKGESDFVFTLQGDNSNPKDSYLSGQQTIDTSVDGWNYIIGKVKGQNYLLGATINSLKEPAGIILIVIVPCLLIVAYEAYRILTVVKDEKNEKIEAEKNEKNEEIAALRKELESLKASDKADSPKEEENLAKGDTPQQEESGENSEKAEEKSEESPKEEEDK